MKYHAIQSGWHYAAVPIDAAACHQIPNEPSQDKNKSTAMAFLIN